MPEQVIAAIMQRRNPRTGQNYTREEAERIIAGKKDADSWKAFLRHHRAPKNG
jgi:hypothetical protein